MEFYFQTLVLDNSLLSLNRSFTLHLITKKLSANMFKLYKKRLSKKSDPYKNIAL